jgi:Fe-S cluster biosynthesis and repair protein YggX
METPARCSGRGRPDRDLAADRATNNRAANRGFLMTLTCVRCGKPGEAPPSHRVPFAPAVKEKVLASVCTSCWKEWEDMEIKVINEYRLNFLEPEHRAMLQRACLEFLTLSA